MKVDDSLANTRGLLTQWGRWVRSGGSGVSSYRCPLGSLRGGGVPSPVITDDVALRVDAEVLALKARMPTTGTAVELYYSRPGITYEQVGRVMRLGGSRARREVRDLVLVGEAWLDARLHEVVT